MTTYEAGASSVFRIYRYPYGAPLNTLTSPQRARCRLPRRERSRITAPARTRRSCPGTEPATDPRHWHSAVLSQREYRPPGERTLRSAGFGTRICGSIGLVHRRGRIGSDSWRKLGGPVCDNRMVRQDLLDQIVWTEVIRLLEDPALIQHELDRRLAAARAADPTKQREQTVQRDLVRVGKSIERVLTAYQEDLLSLEQLRERMPSLRQREQALRAELQSIA